MTVELSKTEFDTVLAALRYWARHQANLVGTSTHLRYEDDIATDGGDHPPLRAGEVNALCDRLNTT